MKQILDELQPSITFHYALANEIVGSNFSPRIVDGDAIANPNRNGIPGARVTGQRAIRAVVQTTNPPVYVDVGGIEYAASRTGLGGLTVTTDMIDISHINAAVNPVECENPCVPASSTRNLNGTAFLEVYPAILGKQIHSDSIALPHLDENGFPVPDCLDASVFDPLTERCDGYEYDVKVIRGFKRPLTLSNLCPGSERSTFDRYSIVDSLRNDYFSLVASQCGGSSRRAASEAEMNLQVKRLIIGHEVGHALGMEHNCDCGNIEYIRAGTTDPFASTFTSTNINEIRLVP